MSLQCRAGRIPLVVRGFIFASGGIGGDASALQLISAGGALLHFSGSESGTLLTIPDDRAVEVLGSAFPPRSHALALNSPRPSRGV